MSFMSDSITIQLLSGDLVEVEVYPNDSYLLLYLRVFNQLPEELRVPGGLDAMILLLNEELVPLCHLVAEISKEIYYLFIDTMSYKVFVDWPNITEDIREIVVHSHFSDGSVESSSLGTVTFDENTIDDQTYMNGIISCIMDRVESSSINPSLAGKRRIEKRLKWELFDIME